MFEGKNYKEANAGPFIDLPQRARKRNYDVNDYYKDAVSSHKEHATEKQKKEPKGPKGITMHDFQFYDRSAVEAIEEEERDLFMKRRTQTALVKGMFLSIVSDS